MNPTAIDALQAIADLPYFGGDKEDSIETAYRAVEALFKEPPQIFCSPKESD